MTEERVERDAIVSGIGMSRIGRKTGISDAELTVESATAAIADAGISASDIDGIATIGDTPIAIAAEHLGLSPDWTGGSMGHYGLQTPVVDAFKAVGSRAARHVLVYRTVNMMGGEAIQERSDGTQMEIPPAMRDITRMGKITSRME